MRVGTLQHRDFFCRTFVETHVAFEPEELPWPQLDDLYLRRLRAFPFWTYATSIEQRAGRMVKAFADTIDDPVIREAVTVQGIEEARHGVLMAHLLKRYEIDAEAMRISEPPMGKEEFSIFGFGECTDSFIGFGAFALVRKLGLLPPALLDIFDNLLYEEARHIVFFINWWRYEEALAGRDQPLVSTFNALKRHVRAVLGTAKSAADVPPMPKLDDPELVALVKSVTPAMFLETALAENRRVMARLNRRLIKPTIMPAIATALLLAIRMLPPRVANASPSSNGALSAQAGHTGSASPTHAT